MFWTIFQIIAITVEEEEDIAKFKDYAVSEKGAASPPPEEPKKSSEPTPAKKEAAPAEPEPKASKPSQTPSSEDRIFASPLARKLAEDNKVSNNSTILSRSPICQM